MGNQRQVLKDKLEKELLLKIKEAKDVLNKLNKNLEINKQNSLTAYEDIKIAVDLIKGVLMKREKAMLQEVEFLRQDQERSLKEAIKSTYMTLGSLQSTLTNLPSFDQGQLVKLQIPNVDWACAETEPAKITAAVDCEDLQEELKEWGSVNADGFQYCMDIQNDEGSLRCQENNSCVDMKQNPIKNIVTMPDAPASKPINECPNPLESGWWNNNIQEWLSETSSKNVAKNITVEDEFVVVPSLQLDDDMEFYYPGNKVGKTDSSSRGSFSAPLDDGDSSSIMCISRENNLPNDDLSVWLKPRKASIAAKPMLSNKDQNTPCCGTALLSIENFRVKRKASNISSNQFLDTWKASKTQNTSCGATEVLSIDNFRASPGRKAASDKQTYRYVNFPCLRMDSDSWIRKKKPKTTSSSISSGRKLGLIPATYDMPNPFWLRKYRLN
ncbi:unnamed protein product [Orchesella dallaii]|uniref:Uncharacterized protein n=1 Tax=Orchesella dallaii TaxID=48710 RepID=A0ABP1QMC1_9HEXA